MTKGRTPYRVCGPFLCLLLIAGCGDRTKPSAEENRQLQNAAEMLDAAPDQLANIDDNGLDEPSDNSVNADE